MVTPENAVDQPRIFQCPNCKEFINTSMAECRFCHVPVDHNFASVAAETQDKTNAACNDASFLKTVARVTVIVYLTSWIPFIGWFGSIAFLILMIAVPIMEIRWYVKYSGIPTKDADYNRAKRDAVVALAIWGAMIVVWILVVIIYAVLVVSLSGKPR